MPINPQYFQDAFLEGPILSLFRSEYITGILFGQLGVVFGTNSWPWIIQLNRNGQDNIKVSPSGNGEMTTAKYVFIFPSSVNIQNLENFCK